MSKQFDVVRGGEPSRLTPTRSKFKHPEIHKMVSAIELPCDDWFYVDVGKPEKQRILSYISNAVKKYHKGYYVTSNIVDEDADTEDESRLWFKICKYSNG